MFGPTFSDYYRTVTDKFNQDILRESETQILGSDVNDLANYFYQKYALVLLEFDPSDITYEMKKEVRRVPARQRDEFYRDSGDLNYDYATILGPSYDVDIRNGSTFINNEKYKNSIAPIWKVGEKFNLNDYFE